MNISAFNLDERLPEAISYINFENTAPIQKQVIPVILQNQYLIANPRTGKRKTAAYMLSILPGLA